MNKNIPNKSWDDAMKYPYIVQDNPKMNISRRDYFAGLVLQSVIEEDRFDDVENHAALAVLYADALIKKLDEVK